MVKVEYLLAVALLTGNAASFSSLCAVSTRSAGRANTEGAEKKILTSTQATASIDLRANPSLQEFKNLGINIPFGLRQTLLTNAREKIAKRFWIVDNSGSMALWDGHQVADDHGDHASSCTRWSEVSETVNCHAQLSAALGAPTDFRLLNPPKNHGPLIRGPQRFRVGYGLHTSHKQVMKDCRRAQSIMLRNEPSGRTPLSASIKEVRDDIVAMAPQLEAEGSKACLVIATDGANYNAQNIGLHVDEQERNKELLEALALLRGLPVVVIIRLCTDYQPVVDFYNSLNKEELELHIDILDDHMAEAEEVDTHNPWLNYALVLHRTREMGQDNQLFHTLDERPLERYEIRDFCVLLFGDRDLLVGDWETFLKKLDNLQAKERLQWNPITKELGKWIDLNKLAAMEDQCIHQ